MWECREANRVARRSSWAVIDKGENLPVCVHGFYKSDLFVAQSVFSFCACILPQVQQKKVEPFQGQT